MYNFAIFVPVILGDPAAVGGEPGEVADQLGVGHVGLAGEEGVLAGGHGQVAGGRDPEETGLSLLDAVRVRQGWKRRKRRRG